MIENKETIKGNQIADILRGAMGHRATWTGLTYIKAKEEGKTSTNPLKESFAHRGNFKMVLMY